MVRLYDDRDAEVQPALADGALEEQEVGGAAADVDVRPVRVGPDRRHLGPEQLEGLRRQRGVGPVRAVDGDAQAAEV